MIISKKMKCSNSVVLSASKCGFTLIELLTVIAILSILSGISFGVIRGVRSAQNSAKAQAELAVLAEALEQYKAGNGDYPWTPPGDPTNSDPDDAMEVAIVNGEILLNALMGWGRFVGSAGATSFDSSKQGRAILDVSKFTVRLKGADQEHEEYPDSSVAPAGYYLSDPWGKPYVYVYAQDASRSTWQMFGYHLYSKGSDAIDSGASISFTSGVVDHDDSYRYNTHNADNIYVGE